jgi:hypothetical protein
MQLLQRPRPIKEDGMNGNTGVMIHDHSVHYLLYHWLDILGIFLLEKSP